MVLLFVIPLVSVIVLCFAIEYATRKRKSQDRNNIMLEKGAYHCASFYHFAGLPVSEGVNCTLYLYNDRIEIESSGNKFSLLKDKITDICTKTDVEIQKHYVSSAGGAIAGGIMFGTLGAIIGGRSKQKTTENIKRYLIITYIKDDDVDYVAFDITTTFVAGIDNTYREFIEDFKQTKRTIQTIEL